MNAQSETFEEDEYEEYDEFDDEEEERGLSGLVVLLMGVVMLGAFVSVVWIAYQQGMSAGADGRNVPTVVADPEPLKIENEVADDGEAVDRPVYDRYAGGADDESVEVVAEAPEEPINRDAEDPIAAIAAENEPAVDVVDDAVADRIADLAAADAALDEVAADEPAPAEEETPAPVVDRTPAVEPEPEPVTASSDPLSGTHLVQVGAFRSQAEADGFWSRLEGKLGDFVDGKGPDVERADLGDRGIYYRLRIGPFASSSAAKTYCEGLKTRGQDCLVKTK